MTPILNRFDIKPEQNKNGDIPQAYRDAITRVIRQRQSSDRNLHLLDGLELINDRIYLWVAWYIQTTRACSAWRMASPPR
jgi:hypothetical protein